MVAIKLLIGVGISFLVVCAHAQSDVSTFGEIDQLRARNALLEAQVKNAELEKKLSELSIGVSNTGSKNFHSQPFIATPAQAKFAQVLSVSGNSAIILLPNGAAYPAKVGSVIPGIGTVKTISIHEVRIANNNTITTLPFVQTDLPGATPSAYFSPGVY